MIHAASEHEGHAIALARITARKMHRPALHRIPYDDIEGAALLGAAKALAQWDASRGVKFRSYALVLIEGEIREEMRRWDWLPRGVRKRVREAYAATGDTPLEYAEPVSLDEMLAEDGDAVLDHLPADVDVEAEALANIEQEAWLSAILALSPSQRTSYYEHYFLDARLSDICHDHGMSKSWAKQIQAIGRPQLKLRAEARGLSG